MKETITIAGHPFTVDSPYEEGHELTANEAAALNQTRHENLRNNFASKVKAALEEGKDPASLQSEFDEYAAAYAFGVRGGGGGGPRDPITTEAMNMARQIIRQAIKQKGGDLKKFEAAAISEAAKKLVDSNPEIRAEAEKRVKAQQEAASVGLGDILAGLTTAKPSESKAA